MPSAPTAPAPVRPRRWTVAAGGALLGLGLVLTGCTAEGGRATPGPSDTYLQGVLNSPSRASQNPLQQDIDFATKALQNHRDAARQSERFLARPEAQGEIRTIAEGIRDRGNDRVRRLTDLLNGWNAPVPSDEPDAPDAAATSSLSVAEEAAAEVQQATADLRANRLTKGDWDALSSADADNAPNVYLLQMHRLHQGALTIAANELRSDTDAAGKQIAQEITDQDRPEMDRMIQILRGRGAIGADQPRTAPNSGYSGPFTLKPSTSAGAPSSSSSAASPSPSPRSSSPRPTPSPADTARPTPSPRPGRTTPSASVGSSGPASASTGSVPGRPSAPVSSSPAASSDVPAEIPEPGAVPSVTPSE